MPDPADQFAPDDSRDLLILAGDITDGNRQFGVFVCPPRAGCLTGHLRARQP